MLKPSSGIGGRGVYTGGLKNDDASATANFATSKTPKYTASFLFLQVIAYTLRRNGIS